MMKFTEVISTLNSRHPYNQTGVAYRPEKNDHITVYYEPWYLAVLFTLRDYKNGGLMECTARRNAVHGHNYVLRAGERYYNGVADAEYGTICYHTHNKKSVYEGERYNYIHYATREEFIEAVRKLYIESLTIKPE